MEMGMQPNQRWKATTAAAAAVATKGGNQGNSGDLVLKLLAFVLAIIDSVVG